MKTTQHNAIENQTKFTLYFSSIGCSYIIVALSRPLNVILHQHLQIQHHHTLSVLTQFTPECCNCRFELLHYNALQHNIIDATHVTHPTDAHQATNTSVDIPVLGFGQIFVSSQHFLNFYLTAWIFFWTLTSQHGYFFTFTSQHGQYFSFLCAGTSITSHSVEMQKSLGK